jgi:serine/threonine protein kinase
VSSVTEKGPALVVGKWQYMAPEATREEPVDHRSDLFSLGVVLYEVLAGEAPFQARASKEIVRKIREGEYTRLAAPVPARLAALVDSMLAPDPKLRPRRGQDVVRALDEIARAEGVDPSMSALSRRLTELFPDDVASPQHRPLEIGDFDASGVTSHTPRSISKVDQSITFHQRLSRSMSIPPASATPQSIPIPVVPSPSSPILPPAQAKDSRGETSSGRGRGVRIALVLLVVVAIALVSYFLGPL